MMNPKNGPIATMNSLRILTSILAICHFHSLRQVYTLLRVGHKEEKRLEFCTFWKNTGVLTSLFLPGSGRKSNKMG